MLYRVQPNGQVCYWCPQPGDASSLQIAAEDPDRLNWEPRQTYFTAVLAVALRHGSATSSGLIVSSGLVADGIHAAALRELQDRVVEQRNGPEMRAAQSAVNAFMGEGWARLGEKTAAESDRAAEDGIAAAEAAAMEHLRAPVKDDLVAHWTSLGGVLPPAATLE